MPTYSYRCTSCGNEFDVRQSFSEEPLKVCENCGGDLRKLFNSVGIVFKGSGFYHNDAKAGSGALQAKSAQKSETSEASTEASSQAASSTSSTASDHSSATGSGTSSSAKSPSAAATS